MDEAINTAELLVERYLGYAVTPKEHTDHLKLGKYGFELVHNPFISLSSVKAKTEEWGVPGMNLGPSIWLDISLEQVEVFQHGSLTLLHVPPTLFGTPYTELMATYKAGYSNIPDAIKQAINQIENLVHKGEIDSWNCQFPIDVLEVLDSYRKEMR